VTDDWRLTTADFLVDAAHFPGGHAAGVVFPKSTEDVVDAVAQHATLLPIGAQSSLTGGATPMGETILATSRMARIVSVTPRVIVVEPGVTVAAMQDALREVDAWFPPAPTYTGACAGGVVATNAAGAATFKYGSTRAWVDAITVVLADQTVLDIARGSQRARDGCFRLETRSGTARVPVPRYRMPDVVKRSAGYHAEPEMDLIDLFIGSEGTLGIVTRITFRIASPAPLMAMGFVTCPDERQGLRVAGELRRASKEAWRTGNRAGLDVSAIEHMDRRSLEIVHEDGVDRRHNVTVPANTRLALLVQLELPPNTSDETAYSEVERALSDATLDSPLARFCRLLDASGLLENTELAPPQQAGRIRDFIEIREAVPAAVNQRVGTAKRTIDDRIEKTAADMIVPFERFAEMMAVYRAGFERRGLDYAVWGHISDGNVHPNVIPRDYDDVVRGKEAILEFGRAVVEMGGCPLAEHGVGRSAVKQALLEQLYGRDGLDDMRRVKQALDPGWKLAPGVLFQRSRPA
jgi:D-lactate dehydrogenase (cytochrome)